MIQNYINHIVFVVDKSLSMSRLSDKTVKVFDNQIKHLAVRSKELNQETRVSVYLFSSDVECLIYDMDVMRLPSLAKHYRVNGMTALIAGTNKAIDDLKKTPELYGDHAFLIYVLTDGEENYSYRLDPTYTSSQLSNTISRLPENWTLGVLVPDARGVHEAKKFGFPANNISIWETSDAGLSKVESVLTQSTERFMTARSKGIRSTKSLFEVDLNATVNEVKKQLDPLDADDYLLISVHRDTPIKDFVESWTQKPYVKGSTYFQLTKPETVQNYKQVCIQHKRNGKVYSGDNARGMLGLPNHEVKVTPGNFGDFDIFIQSTSSNRKLIGGTKVIILN